SNSCPSTSIAFPFPRPVCRSLSSLTIPSSPRWQLRAVGQSQIAMPSSRQKMPPPRPAGDRDDEGKLNAVSLSSSVQGFRESLGQGFEFLSLGKQHAGRCVVALPLRMVFPQAIGELAADLRSKSKCQDDLLALPVGQRDIDGHFMFSCT